MLAALTAGVFVMGLAWWSPSVEGSSREPKPATPDLAAARALAAVLVDHLPDARQVSGRATQGGVEASAVFANLVWRLRLIVDPVAGDPVPCAPAGSNVELECRRLADGSTIEASVFDACRTVRQRETVLEMVGDERLDDGLTPELVRTAGEIGDFREEAPDEMISALC